MELTKRLMLETDFSDLNRLKDLVLEMKNELDANFAPSGHLYASSCSSRRFSRARGIDELWNGLSQVFFVHKLARLARSDISKISAKLKAIQAGLSTAGLLLNYTGSKGESVLNEIGARFGSFGPPGLRNKNCENAKVFFELSDVKDYNVFASPSLQVGFAALSYKAEPYFSPLRAAELVLSHQLSTGALWEVIRMKGGAYGAFAQPNNLEGRFSLSSYRDPDPLRSLEAFSSVVKKAYAQAVKEEADPRKAILRKSALDKAVIGAYAPETCPKTPAEKGITDFLRFLTGIEDSHRSRRLKDLVAVSEEQIAGVLERLSHEAGGDSTENNAKNNAVIITGKAQAEKAALRLGTKTCDLPV
jgi:Zn-dependent M16 (insulinase) family peptidase